jgi:hypothetical protein
MSVIVWRDDERMMVVKGNNNDEWSTDIVLLWLGRIQNGDTVEW